jgi:glycosyltransferase involved in cell wall biosynthesis
MIINHFNTLLGGGAAVAARRIHESLRLEGVESRFWHRGRKAPSPDGSYRAAQWRQPRDRGVTRLKRRLTHQINHVARKRELRQALRGRPAGLELFSIAQIGRPTVPPIALLDADVIHLHWLAWWIDYPSFFAALPPHMPIVWTLHDMNPLTGGCHYTGGCEAFHTACGNCPQLAARGPRDLAQRGFEVKRQALAGKNLNIVANSTWLERHARRSALFADASTFQTIHYGLDVELYAPRPKAAAKRELGLPADHVVIAFGAEAVDNARKGMHCLAEALAMLRPRAPIALVFFGKGDVPREKLPPVPRVSMGFVSDPRRHALLYSAADLYVMPSLEETFGQTGLEAMACGTPVVGFDTGGMPDFIRPNHTGLLAEVGDARDLARQMQVLIDHPRLRLQLGENARAMVVDEFRADQAARKYIDLYESIVAQPATSFESTRTLQAA